jgi:hypothetical protein
MTAPNPSGTLLPPPTDGTRALPRGTLLAAVLAVAGFQLRRLFTLPRLAIAALGVGDRETVAFKHRLDQAALRRVVIDDKDRFGHMKTPTGLDARSSGEALFLSLIDTGRW